MTDVPAELKELSSTLAGIESVLDLDKLRGEVTELERKASAPDLWDDPANAQKVTSRLSYAQGEIRAEIGVCLTGSGRHEEARRELLAVQEVPSRGSRLAAAHALRASRAPLRDHGEPAGLERPQLADDSLAASVAAPSSRTGAE